MRARTVIVATCALLLCAAPGRAHDERSIDALTVLAEVSPHVPGLDIRVVHLGAPAIAVDNETGRVLEVSGISGEPFLRIGPDGVFANIESPTIYRSIDPNVTAVPASTDASATPKWVRLSTATRWSWFDPRLRHGRDADRWSIPMTLDATAVTVVGGFEPLDGHGHFVTELNVEQVPGLDIQLTEGPIAALFVRNSTTRTLHVSGSAGEPFLRIGPRGVFANLRSPDYYTGGSLTIKRVPPSADAGAAPRWKKLSDRPVWGWLESRSAVAPEQQERNLLGPVSRTVHSWTVPMTLGSRSVEVAGNVVWNPSPGPPTPRSSGTNPGSILLTVIALAVVAQLARLVFLRKNGVCGILRLLQHLCH